MTSRFGRAVVALRWPIALAWIVAAALTTALLPSIEESQTGALGDLVPNDAAAIDAELRSAELFGFPLLSRTIAGHGRRMSATSSTRTAGSVCSSSTDCSSTASSSSTSPAARSSGRVTSCAPRTQRAALALALAAARDHRPPPCLPVTHDVLAQLVCAQRPTVESALKRLSDQGQIRRRSGKTWLLAPEPPPVAATVRAQLDARPR